MIKEDSLALETRRKIYNLILNYPGLHEREIARKLNISLSTLDYHLHYLEKREIIVSKKDGRYTRYFASLKVGMQDKKIIAILRQKTPRKIVLFLLMHPGSIHKEICEGVKKSPSTISFHLKKMIDAGIIEAVSLGRETAYSVKDEEEVVKMLITYKNTFLDSAVDSFIETWSSLNPEQVKKFKE
ncbi:MAG: transcriptional regulator [Thermoplasmata archaeon]|nr:MAG: winged helix-turn-helix transcriptional regulator [Thermoplasmata archaeon]RLF63891.1 MAG: transcriptional regulator [Thermoplasmata archaeon]